MQNKSSFFSLHFLKSFRHRLSHIDALPQLTLLGTFIGLAVGLLIVIFRVLVELALSYLLPEHSENFEGLTSLEYFLFPTIGSALLALGLFWLSPQHRHVSVGHVLERLYNFQGRMPLPNFIVQFFGGVLSLITGQSVGREGPAVHIGASASSLIGQWLRLPNNSLSTLVACGVAAAISASFNTPIAGVIFAMEVVLVRYTITGYIPIIVASVCGSLMTRATIGVDSWFGAITPPSHHLGEVPLLVLAGAVIALFASAYTYLQTTFTRYRKLPFILCILAAGTLTGCIGLIFPEVLGLGYDTINLSIEGQLSVAMLLGIALAKLIATSFSIGMGIPGGLIGPQLVIGACVGGAMGIISNQFFPGIVSDTSTYTLLGMAGMMGAVLNAPLAAITAIVELTYTPAVIFPGMLVIAVSCILTRFLTQSEGIFLEQLKLGGTQLSVGPIKQLLNDIGVRSAMNTSFVESPKNISLAMAARLLEKNPLWVIIRQEEQLLLLRASDLAALCRQCEEQEDVDQEENIDLLEIPGQRYNLANIHELATLWEAKVELDQKPNWALLVIPQIQTTPEVQALGVISTDTINHYYR